MRLIVNDVLTEEDKNAIVDGTGDVEIPYFDVSDIQKIKETLSERDNHFFNCLAWLIRHNRLDIKIRRPYSTLHRRSSKARLPTWALPEAADASRSPKASIARPMTVSENLA